MDAIIACMEIMTNSSIFENKSGKIILRNGPCAKLLGKGSVDIDIKNIEIVNVLLVDGLKDKILSVIQIDDTMHVIVFTSNGCRIIEEDTRKNITKGFKSLNNLYVLKKNLGRNKRSSSSSSYLE